MEYIDFSGQAGAQEAADDIAAGGTQTAQHFTTAASSFGPDPPKPSYLNPGFPMSCDIKPRLTKEQHDILENHFQQQSKPNTNTKKSFAEALNVSLDKVNNWFQNRRAKSKQEVRKREDPALNLRSTQQQSYSDSDTSPGFVDNSSDYHARMQQWSEEQASNGLGISQMRQTHEHAMIHGLPVQVAGTNAGQYNGYLMPHHYNDMFNSQEELNRRTLTQEQFDAMERGDNMLNGSVDFTDLDANFYADQNGLAIFPEAYDDVKQQDVFAFPHPAGAPMGSYDSTIPSSNSEQSLSAFPSSSNMHNQATVSTTSSDWTDSRSSSIHEGAMVQMPTQQQTPASTAQWQPGQSVPVDSTQQYEEFRQVAAQAAHARTSPQQQLFEQPLAWPDDAFVRRGSSASMLAHSMSHVGIQTPPQQQQGTFKSPAPPSNIAARRQRAPRPATLGLNALRSQSHSGAVHPSSPGHVQQQQQQQYHLADQPLRRIRSSNYIGGVAHGRVMKSVPGSAQRSPLNFTFADAMNSSHAVRHVSQGSLAPPTPMSPKESSNVEQTAHHQQMPTTSGNLGHQESISETDLEHGLDYQPSVLAHGQNWTSPPHTPMYYPQQFIHHHVNGSAVENTPPQSAPASQTCFPSTVFAMPQQQTQQQQVMQSQGPMQQQIQAVAMAHPQQYMTAVAHEHQMQMPNVTYVQTQQGIVAVSGPQGGVPVHFAGGVPVVAADGNIQMAYPPQMQFVQQGQTPPQHVHTPPQVAYAFATSAGGSPSSQVTAQPPNAASDFFVHEYSPPESVKRTATPRKGPVDTAPKSYAFAHTGPEHFEEKQAEDKKHRKSSAKDSATSSSPASSSGTASTS